MYLDFVQVPQEWPLRMVIRRCNGSKVNRLLLGIFFAEPSKQHLYLAKNQMQLVHLLTNAMVETGASFAES